MKQRKATKIKRYRRSFNGQAERSLVLRRILTFLFFLLLLFGVGWLLAKPGIDIGTKLWYSLKAAVEPKQAEEPRSAPVQSSVPPVGSLPQSAPAIAKSPIAEGLGKWAYVSLSSLDTPEHVGETARMLSAKGISAAVITLKDSRGFIYYPSGVPAAAANIAESTIDAAAVAKAMQENGIAPIAAIAAFEDANAPMQDRNMAVTYMGQEGFLWLNNKAELGGVPWLNPYSPVANTYISELLQEVLGFGFKEVILSSVQFPSGFGLDLAGYREGEDTRGKQQVLTDCVAAWQKQCEDAGVVCWFEYAAAPAIGEGDATTAVSALTLGAKNVLLDFAGAVQETDGVNTLDTALLDAASAKAKQNNINLLSMRVSNGKLDEAALGASADFALQAGYASAVVQ